jgi:hypothetical protein
MQLIRIMRERDRFHLRGRLARTNERLDLEQVETRAPLSGPNCHLWRQMSNKKLCFEREGDMVCLRTTIYPLYSESATLYE